MRKKPFLPAAADAERIEQRKETCLPREALLKQLQSPDGQERARAVRGLCPCRTTWETPLERYVLPMLSDPDERVRQEARHVLSEDTPEDPYGWRTVRNAVEDKSSRGTKLSGWRSKPTPIVPDEEDASSDGEAEAPGLGWRRRPRPRTKGAAARLAWSPRPRR